MSRQGIDGRRLVAGLALALAVGACASNRTPERSFTVREEAAAAGMFDAAGVPADLVPASARQLRERRDLDTGDIWARFEFEAGDGPAVPVGCKRVADARLPGSVTRGIAWWPELLRGDMSTARQHFDFFACPAPGGRQAHLAVHRAMTTAFFWRGR
jgi:hypothetical protein